MYVIFAAWVNPGSVPHLVATGTFGGDNFWLWQTLWEGGESVPRDCQPKARKLGRNLQSPIQWLARWENLDSTFIGNWLGTFKLPYCAPAYVDPHQGDR